MREWESRGVQRVKRVELDDVKTCEICLALNTKEYDIYFLLELSDPLIHDTHPNCRGAFTPIINNISKYTDSFQEEPIRFNMNTANVTLTNAPIEFKPWFEQFFKRVSVPFPISFEDELDSDYEFRNGELLIHPTALHDEDPREIITEQMARVVPADIQKRTVYDYRKMMELGLVIPPITTTDDSILFVELYQQYLLNQLDDAYEVLYFKTFFDGTEWGKK